MELIYYCSRTTPAASLFPPPDYHHRLKQLADIFISYSNFDKEKAVKLCGRLRNSGFSVWIDESNISAATQWSSEIVRAIEECHVFIILLSEHSFGSHNVIKELSLASEEKKHIIPIELEPIELTHEVKYQLAGIQRVPYKEYDRIEAAIRRFIVIGEPEKTPAASAPKKRSRMVMLGVPLLAAVLAVGAYFFFFAKNGSLVQNAHAFEIKKIVVLPFESLSADKEDEFFADGLTAQVITTLSGLQGFQITDRKTSMNYKDRKGDLAAVAKELGVRYVVDGTVEKHGKNIKITSQLIDAESGKVLLSNQFDGTTDDLFGLEGKLARSIAFELQGSLGHQATVDSVLLRQGTTNPEAYSKFVLGLGYLENVRSKEQAEKGLVYIEEALKLDPKYAFAQVVHAFYFLFRFQMSNGAYPHDLVIADSLAKIAIALDPTISEAHYARAVVARTRGETDSALREANLMISIKADNFGAHSFVGAIYYERGQFDLAAVHFESAVQKNITDLFSWSLLIGCLSAIGDTAKRNRYIDESLPLYDLYLEKNPADASTRIHYALSLAYRGLKDRSHTQIAQILKATEIDPGDYYNIACIYSVLNELKPAIGMLRTSLDKGYTPGEAINTDPDFKNIRNTPEFKALAKRAVETKNNHVVDFTKKKEN